MNIIFPSETEAKVLVRGGEKTDKQGGKNGQTGWKKRT
jgi:hypothetical protein